MSVAGTVSDRALGWVLTNVNCFNPLQNQPKPDEVRHKAFVELGLMCMYLSRQPAFARDQRLKDLLDFVAATCHLPFFREAIFRVSNMFVPHALLAAILRSCGFDDDPERWRAVQELIERANVEASERPPFRTMELRYLLDLGKLPHRLPSYKHLYLRGILGRPLNVLYVTDADAYAVTHTLFYLSDFGSKPISAISSRRRPEVDWVVEHLLGMYIRSGNLDLVGELLLSRVCLNRQSSQLSSIGWRAVSLAQTAEGLVPGPYYDPAKATSLESDERRDYVFEQCYHTTLVAAMAGAICGTVEDVSVRDAHSGLS